VAVYGFSLYRSGIAVLLAWGLLIIGTPSSAEASDGPRPLGSISLVQNSKSGGAEARSIISAGGRLTLEAYLSAVDVNFPGLASATDQKKIASANRLEKQGVFDPLFSTENGYTRLQNTSKIGEGKEVIFNYPKIELPFESGIRVFGQYRYNPTSNQSPYIGTGEGGEYSAGIFMPLMRGLIYNEQSVALRQARYGEQLAAETFILTRLDTLLRAGTIYWSWVGAKRKADVSREIQGLAILVANISTQQERSGDLARIYVTEAEEDVQRRNADLSQAQRDFQRFSFRLSSLLFDIGDVPLPLPTEVNVPESMPRPQEFSQSDTEHHVMAAMTRRPELKAIDIQKKSVALDLKLAQNQMLPAVNVVLTQGYDTGKDSIGYTYRGQGTISQPLLMRTARGKVAAAKLRLDKLEKDRQAESQRIRNEVYDAISAINLAYQRFVALEVQVDKAQQVYLGERERFKVGDSTVFLIAERERQLNEAKIRLIDAEVEYHVGVLALRAITSQL
jgi:outer membrane protein TolC